MRLGPSRRAYELAMNRAGKSCEICTETRRSVPLDLLRGSTTPRRPGHYVVACRRCRDLLARGDDEALWKLACWAVGVATAGASREIERWRQRSSGAGGQLGASEKCRRCGHSTAAHFETPLKVGCHRRSREGASCRCKGFVSRRPAASAERAPKGRAIS